MIDVRLDTRKPLNKLVDYLYNQEKHHLLVEVDTHLWVDRRSAKDPTKWTDEELYNYCVENDIDHIWLDCYIVQKLIEDDEASDETD